MAVVAGRIGIPMIGIGYFRSTSLPEMIGFNSRALITSDLDVCVFLIAFLGATWHWDRKAGKPGDLATTLLATAGMGMSFAFGYSMNYPIMRLGVCMFVTAGLIITPDRHKVGSRKKIFCVFMPAFIHFFV